MRYLVLAYSPLVNRVQACIALTVLSYVRQFEPNQSDCRASVTAKPPGAPSTMRHHAHDQFPGFLIPDFSTERSSARKP